VVSLPLWLNHQSSADSCRRLRRATCGNGKKSNDKIHWTKKKGRKPTCCAPWLLKNENYQRLRPLLLLSRPPAPRLSRLAIGLASFTVSVRPSSCVPFKA
jgi:hypothetical protein